MVCSLLNGYLNWYFTSPKSWSQTNVSVSLPLKDTFTLSFGPLPLTSITADQSFSSRELVWRSLATNSCFGLPTPVPSTDAVKTQVASPQISALSWTAMFTKVILILVTGMRFVGRGRRLAQHPCRSLSLFLVASSMRPVTSSELFC